MSKQIEKQEAPQLVKVAFHGDEVEAVVEGGTVWVPLKRCCEALGIDHDDQREKLKQRSWATTVLSTVVAADGKQREMYCVNLHTLTMWLARRRRSRNPIENVRQERTNLS